MTQLRCPQCSTIVEKPAHGAPVCHNCGYGASQAAPVAAGGHAGHNAGHITDGYGVSSFILSLFSSPLFAVIFGLVGIGHVNKHPELKGKGWAVAGLIIGLLRLIFVIILIIVLFAIFEEAWDAFRDALDDEYGN